jgi:hypothetical protein
MVPSWWDYGSLMVGLWFPHGGIMVSSELLNYFNYKDMYKNEILLF